MSCKLIEVIESYELRGTGIEKNPIRTIRVYYTKDGEVLAEYDPLLARPEFPFKPSAESEK